MPVILTDKQQVFFDEKLRKYIKVQETYTIFLCLFGFFGLHRLYLNQHLKGLIHFISGAFTYSLFIYSAMHGHNNRLLIIFALVLNISLISTWIYDLINRKKSVNTHNQELTRKLFDYAQNLELD